MHVCEHRMEILIVNITAHTSTDVLKMIKTVEALCYLAEIYILHYLKIKYLSSIFFLLMMRIQHLL